jgi:magnesium-transporting ATPase (P-type)
MIRFSYLYKKNIKNNYNKTIFNKVLENAGVFARMKPEEKALLVQCLQV